MAITQKKGGSIHYSEKQWRYISKVMSKFNHMNGCRYEHLDLCQIAWLRVARYVPDDRLSGTGAWLWSSAREYLQQYDECEHLNEQGELAGDEGPNPDDDPRCALEDNTATPVDHADSFEYYLSFLTEAQAEAVRLYFADGYNMSEIGAQLDISKQAVHCRIRRALRNLKTIVADTLRQGPPELRPTQRPKDQ